METIEISTDTYPENETEILFDHHGRSWLNETHIEKELGYSCLRQTVSLCPWRYYSSFKKFEQIINPIEDL